MTGQSLTVGTGAVQVPFDSSVPAHGAWLLGRAGNSGNIYVGFTPGVTTGTGNLIPNGSFGTTTPYVIPLEHFANGGVVYVVADGANQTLDWAKG